MLAFVSPGESAGYKILQEPLALSGRDHEPREAFGRLKVLQTQ